ncbi:MAG: caspase family protein [Rhizobiales bacterium]|nr:caspase family protein [Hyphomicrobiales bacterium]
MTRTLGILTALVILAIATASAAMAEKRVALVIGNDNYDNVTRLQKAVNDAKAMAGTLRQLGFGVTEASNVARRDMNFAVHQFVNQIEPGDVAMVFFAGHGVEISGENFLLPTDIPDAGPGQEGFVKAESIGLNDILTRLKSKKARLNVIILDACRNNPFSSAGRSLGATRGLARIAAPNGTFVMYSADAGEAALDRLNDNDENPNSVFTRTLIPLMQKPGLDLVNIAREARRQVRQLALGVSHQQTPAYYDAVLGAFYFSGNRSAASLPQDRASPSTPIAADYKLAQEIGTRKGWQAFLDRHGDLKDDIHVKLARAALDAKPEVARIEEIQTTYFDIDGVNSKAISILNKNDGKFVYIDKINADLAIQDNYKIVENCFSEKNIDKNKIFEGHINGESLPVLTAKDNHGNAAFCSAFIQISSLDKRAYPVSAGGTGVVNILVRKKFLVSIAHIGASTIFNLREVD